jgi:hypothetical protein
LDVPIFRINGEPVMVESYTGVNLHPLLHACSGCLRVYGPNAALASFLQMAPASSMCGPDEIAWRN